MKKSILIIGSGGREHALGWKLAQSPHVGEIYFAPGNGGTSLIGKNVDIAVTQVDELLQFAKEKRVDFTVVGQEAALEVGIVDRFAEAGLQIFGPTQSAAKLETSKAFTADFLARHNIARPESYTATNLNDALDYIKSKDPRNYVIKADGLATGKGVILPTTEKEAEEALRTMMNGAVFGKAGETVVIQERLYGQEVSAFAISNGTDIIMLPFFQDHKQALDGDRGPNTGGMGAYTPVPFVTMELAQKIKTGIMQKTVDGMRTDGNEYRGILYGGLFITDKGDAKVIEFNARFGDPECQAMMLAVDEDLFPFLQQSAAGKFEKTSIKTTHGAVATVCLASGGYPGNYEKGKEIYGLESVPEDVVVFHAGTKREEDRFVTNGGRVLNITASGATMRQALDKAYSAIGTDGLHFDNMHFRRDIGFRVLQK